MYMFNELNGTAGVGGSRTKGGAQVGPASGGGKGETSASADDQGENGVVVCSFY